MYPLIATALLATAYPIWESKEIYTCWTPVGQGYEYILEVYTDRALTQLYLTQPTTNNKNVSFTVYDTNLYFHRVKYYLPDTPEDFGYIYLGQFYINLYYGMYTEDIPGIFPDDDSPPEPIPQPEPTQLEPTSPSILTPTAQPSSKKEVYTLPNNMDKRVNIPIINQSVLGIHQETEKNLCNIVIHKKNRNTKYSVNCDVNVHITKVKYFNWGKYFTTEIEGTYPEYIYVDIQVYECKKFTLLDPQTWYGCKEILTDSYNGSTKAIYSGFLIANGKKNNTTNYSFKNSSFSMKNTFLKDIYSKNVALNLSMYLQVKSSQWIDIKYDIKKNLVLPKAQKTPTKKPFSFPLTKLIGVTQWYGCTYYQCPHKGIDFGATKQKVVSIGDGTVVSVGFDRYGGECNQGGKYVVVKHINGMYSTYLHLDSYSVKVNQKVKKGERIAVSGNTGKKNCQNFAYHLHFETRKGRSSSTHTNPVPYIDIDWNLIPTLGYKQFPGRLTGENPHPNF
jgi:murein DD-endopeptidase MepM/ murein hydrolase activator NlpD